MTYVIGKIDVESFIQKANIEHLDLPKIDVIEYLDYLLKVKGFARTKLKKYDNFNKKEEKNRNILLEFPTSIRI